MEGKSFSFFLFQHTKIAPILEHLLVPQLCFLTLRLKHSETDHPTVSYFLHLAFIRCPVSETIVTLQHIKVETLSIIINYI